MDRWIDGERDRDMKKRHFRNRFKEKIKNCFRNKEDKYDEKIKIDMGER